MKPRQTISIDPALKMQMQSMKNLIDEKDKRIRIIEEEISKANLKKTPTYFIYQSKVD